MSPLVFLALALAGGIGAGRRMVVDGVVRARTAERPAVTLPWGTLVINLSGSFVLGLASGLAASALLDENAALVVGAGFCGGYTTFSTASFETVSLLRERRVGAAVVNAAGMLVAGTLCAPGGLLLGTMVAL